MAYLPRAQLAEWDANDAIFPASAPATAGARNEHPLLAFGATVDENVVLSGVIPGEYLRDSLTVTIQWVAATATANDVVWNAAFERMTTDIDADSFAAVQAVTTTAPGTSGVPVSSQITFTQAQADGVVPRDPFRLRITRDANSGSDTMAGDAQVLRVVLGQ